MKRRSFLQNSSAFSIPLLLNGFPLGGLFSRKMNAMLNNDNDKVLVLIQLAGGNDGLNTIFSLDQYADLLAVRENIVAPQSSLLTFDSTRAFNPAMSGMLEMWDNGKLNILQNVGYPSQNRSHFRSTDIWQTASEANEFKNTGWLGRYFDLNNPNYPDAFPNAECPDPFAITVGGGVSETCQGLHGTFSLSVLDPENPGRVNIGADGNTPSNCYGTELEFIRDVAQQANDYAGVIESAANAGNNLSTKYVVNDTLSDKLKTVARLIAGGLKTKVYVVSIGSFDTHAAQVEPGDPLSGRHAELLSSLSDSICAFQDDITLLGLEKRVLGMTFSEFGRRIRSNESNGTDHGTAGPMFFFGSCVNPEVLGDDPEIDQSVDNQEGVAMQYDFRDAYGTILQDWFDVEEADVKSLLYDDFQPLPLIQGCDTVANIENEHDFGISLSPNPASNYCHLEFITSQSSEAVRIELYNSIGSRLQIVSDRKFSAGKHKVTIDIGNYATGSYFVRIRSQYGQKTKKFIKA